MRDDIYLGDRLLASVLASSEVTVSGIDPDSSPVAGGTTVTITGTGFVAGATSVWIGGAMATGVQVDGQGMTLTAVTPAHAPGPVEVVVATAGGSGSLTGAFSYRNVALNRWLGSDSDYASDVSDYRPSTGMWYIRRSTDGAQWIKEFGEPAQGDIPLPGDFDGDGQRDLVVYRPSTGTWFWLQSSSGFTRYGQVGWGLASQGDEPVPGDYDGDGKTDPTVFRPQYGTWFILTSSSGYGAWVQQGWGAPGDIALGGRR